MTVTDLPTFIALALLTAAATTLALLYDRQRARFIALQAYFQLYVDKARSDRNDKVRIPAEQIVEIFELDAETLPAFKLGRRPYRSHPAALRSQDRG